jgi:hypothetical protein
MPQSAIKQNPIWIRKIENNYAHVVLRKNFVEKTLTDDEGNITTYWEYEETNAIIKNRPNIHQYIEENFDNVWLSNPEELAKRFATL